jgi:tetratricopeptide (TPR) repeat protein
MFPERERIPAFQSVLETAQQLKLNNHPPSPEFMQEVFEVVRLARPQQGMLYPLLDLISTIADLDLSSDTNILPYWRAIVVSAILMINTVQHVRHELKTVLITLCSYLTIAPDVDTLFAEVEKRKNDPEWLLCNIEYRLGIVGQTNFDIEYQTALDLAQFSQYSDRYAFMLANCLVTEVCVYYAQNQQAFIYGQQTLAIADYLNKPLYKLGALMVMLPYVLSIKPKAQPHEYDLAKKIIQHWEQFSQDWKTPRQEALFLAIVGPYYVKQQDYETAERYLKKAVQLLEYIEDKTNAIRMQIALAIALTHLEDYRRAIFWCEEAATAARKSRKNLLVAWSLHVHGWSLFKSQQYTDALQKLADGLDESLHLDSSNGKQVRLIGISDELVNVLAVADYSPETALIRDDLLRLINDVPSEEWVETLKAALLNFGAL